MSLAAVAVAAGGALLLFASGTEEAAESAEAFVGGDLHSLVVSPADPSTLYAGGHQAVSVSHDGGRTWSRVETLDDADAMGWAFIDGSVAVGGHPGLSVSEDGGRTFEPRNEGLPATDIHALGGEGDTLYAGSPAVGVLRSLDGGSSWEVLTTQVGQAFMGPILVDPADPEHLIASDLGAGVAESRDGGETWHALGGIEGTMWVTWDPQNPSRFIASGSGGVARTLDGGATWQPVDVPAGVLIVAMSPHEPSTLYGAAHSGSVAEVWVSYDEGASWERP